MVVTAFILLASFIKHGFAFTDLLPVEEWNRFPLLRHVDRFAQCLGDKGGVYCTSKFEFVADGPNELYDAMWNFSKSPKFRLNYTEAVYGYCMTRRCKEFLTGGSDAALQTAMGACLNSTLEREYGLRARIQRADCYRHGQRPKLNWLDWAAAMLFLSFFALVAAGTLYDLFAANKYPKGYLMCFSLVANWRRLVAPWPSDEARARLIGINGLRSITSLLAVVAHANDMYWYVLEDMYFYEKIGDSALFQVSMQCPIMIQTFYFLSGLLMSYNWELSNEKNPKTWASMPRAILLRWLRLAPLTYIVVLFQMTLLKFTPFGPFWQYFVKSEVEGCWKNWPTILTFRQNYDDNILCNTPLWYTSLDFHLHIIGLTVMLIQPNKRIRNIVLWTLLAIGVAMPVLDTYAYDLDGSWLVVPKMLDLEVMTNDKSFKHLHIATHTNITGFAGGLILGIHLLDWQKKSVDFSKYKKYTVLYWLLAPVLAFLTYSNTFVLWGRGDLSTRLLVALVRNPAWLATIALITIGIVFKVEKVPLYRSVLEWSGWVPLARVSFAYFTVHLPVVYWIMGSKQTLVTASFLHMLSSAWSTLTWAVVAGTMVHLVVESPCNNLVTKWFPEKRSALASYPDKTK